MGPRDSGPPAPDHDRLGPCDRPGPLGGRATPRSAVASPPCEPVGTRDSCARRTTLIGLPDDAPTSRSFPDRRSMRLFGASAPRLRSCTVATAGRRRLRHDAGSAAAARPGRGSPPPRPRRRDQPEARPRRDPHLHVRSGRGARCTPGARARRRRERAEVSELGPMELVEISARHARRRQARRVEGAQPRSLAQSARVDVVLSPSRSCRCGAFPCRQSSWFTTSARLWRRPSTTSPSGCATRRSCHERVGWHQPSFASVTPR